MKKSLVLLSALLLGVTSCGVEPLNEELYPTVFCPQGSTLIGIADYAYEHPDLVSLQNGSQVAPAMINKQFDVVLAPLVAGVNVYSKVKNYVLDNIFVWGNLYVLSSNEEVDTLKELDGKNIVSFQKGNTPQIVAESLFKYNNINVTIDYQSDVSIAATSFIGGSADYIVCAEPQVQNILTKKPNTKVIDLQDEWKKMTGSTSYPQAGIFVSKDYIAKNERWDEYVDLLRKSVLKANTDTLDIATKSTTLNEGFQKMGADVIAASIPGCNFGLESKENTKKAVEEYLTKSNEILSTTFVMPDEEFYI